MSFKFEGMDELIRNLEQLGDKAQRIEKDAVMKAAEPIQQEIKKNAPRSPRTNEHGADHIVTEYDEQNKQAVIGAHKDKGWWLIFPEFGTTKQTAQGFTEKSFNNKKAEAQKIIADTIKKELGL